MSEFAHKISGLIIKFHQNDLSPEEQNDLQEWRQASLDNENLFQELTDQQKLVHNLKSQEQGKKKVLDRLMRLIPGLANKEIFHINWRYVAAAGLILFCGVGYYYVSHKKIGKELAIARNANLQDIKAPSGSRTILTLANGRQINLDSVESGTIGDQGNVNIHKLNNGQLVYNKTNVRPTEILYNTLSTARGGQTTLVLADGSKVWLNALSSIRFPAAFMGPERKVELLSGEAYFEIAHNRSVPFILKVKEANVRVLGTHFNVTSYDNEEAIKTTLLQGAIMVSTGRQSEILKPGQQANILPAKSLQLVQEVDTAQIVAWKNGEFQFDRTDLTEVTKQLERWYDIKVEYEQGAPSVRLSGSISRNVNLSNIIKIMTDNGARLNVEGSKIIVLK